MSNFNINNPNPFVNGQTQLNEANLNELARAVREAHTAANAAQTSADMAQSTADNANTRAIPSFRPIMTMAEYRQLPRTERTNSNNWFFVALPTFAIMNEDRNIFSAATVAFDLAGGVGIPPQTVFSNNMFAAQEFLSMLEYLSSKSEKAQQTIATWGEEQIHEEFLRYETARTAHELKKSRRARMGNNTNENQNQSNI